MKNFKPPTFKLSPKQRAFLKAKLQQNDLASQQIQSITPQVHGQPAPLSYAQEWMWLLEQMASPDYNNPLTLRLTGMLNVDVLEQALQEIVDRHAVLRTILDISDDGVKQIAHDHWPLELEHIDVSDVPAEVRQQKAWQLIEQDRRKPFSLTEEPPLRVALLRLQTTEHWLHVTWHHIASDDTSFSIFIRELSALYAAFSKGQSPSLKALSIQYEDYALWQRQRIVSDDWEQQLSYWRQHLQGSSAILDLPKTRNPEAISHSAAQVPFSLPVETTDQVKAFSRQSQVTLFTTLLTAFRILLYRYTNQTDLRIGVPVSLRTHSDLSPLLGVFINTLAIQLDLADLPNSQELLKRVQQTMALAQDHQEIPFHKLMEMLRSEDPHFGPGLPVIFDFQSVALPETVADTLTLTPLESESLHVSASLTLHIEEKANQICGAFRFNPQEIEREMVQRMVDHFQMILKGMMATPATPITHLPILTSTETHTLLTEWNQTQVEYPQDKCIHELFEEQVERTPDAIALIFQDQQLTYAELNTRANQLAYHLQKLGVNSETLVGICLDRSLDMVICLLAVLKAGGAYLPLDPDAPQRRLDFMVEDANTSVLITQEDYLDKLHHYPVQLLCLARDWPNFAQSPTHNLPSKVTTDQLAYVIYTSGSTGHPKGVMIEHRALLNYLFAAVEALRLDSCKHFAMVQPLSVDACITSLFPPLLHSGTLHIIDRVQSLDPVSLETYFALHPPDYLKIAPSHLATLLANSPHPERLLPKQRLILGGEASAMAWVQSLKTLAPHCQVFNHYGPTETTVGVLTYAIDSEHADTDGTITTPLGYPLANTQVDVLDHHLNPVPVGVTGELYIGGANLARCYLNRAELSTERFIPNPFDSSQASRLYKTGDLVRYRENGVLEFLGRIDDQVKIRGFRIELGEIEACLHQHSAIQDCVVLLRDDDQQNKQLVAYWTAADTTEPTVRDLSLFLQKMLPDYMMPATFVQLASLPLSAHGKIDRQALPVPGPIQRVVDNELVIPCTPVEKRLAEIWCDLLNLEQVGVHDNFFELGGHSLLATQVISRIHNDYQIEIPLAALFEAPTIAGFTVKITLTMGGTQQSETGDEDYEQMAALLDELDELSDDMVTQYLTDVPLD